MQQKLPLYYLFYALALLLLLSCSNTRFLTDDQLLYEGKNKVILQVPDKLKNQKAADQVITAVTAYKPNNALAGKRVLPPGGLWIYNYMKPKGKGKLSNWFYRTFAVEPVLISQVNPEMRCQKLQSELFNIGFFHSSVSSKIDTSSRNPRKAKITYQVKLDHPFRYNTISFSPPADAVDSLISSYRKDLGMKPEDVFNLGSVKAETKKITAQVAEMGYYYFNSNHVKFTADTTQTPYRIDLLIGKNNELPLNATQQYSINKVTVKILSPVDSGNPLRTADTILYDGVCLISLNNYLKPKVITRSIFFRKGDIYSTTRQQQTMRNLNGYGIFKFINMQFIPDQDSLVHQMDLLLELTPMKDINLDLEANVVTKSTGFSGPGIVATLSHGNLARGANKLQTKVNGGLEWQWSNKSASALGTVSYNAGITSSIVFPRIISPFKLQNTRRFSIPSTSVNVGFEFLNKVQYYRMSSFNAGFGYQWKKTERITHAFYPVYFNSITLLQTTPEFDSILNANPYIRKSFEEQFIAGMKYDFIYDNSLKNPPHGFYFQAGLSTAGNLIDLIKMASSAESSRPYTTIGNVYSQFLKFSADIRYYRNKLNHSFVFRLYSGLGIPYSNSVVMPYVEQFYSGGTNSIRAFIARSLGPGDYKSDVPSDIIDQTGDIKLEGNAEYRFRLSKTIRGALFLDAGNVWLWNKDESRPGAEFKFDSFINQLAVGTGIGLRFDFNFFILRTDMGFPLRNAYATDGHNWYTSTKDIFSDYVLSLAIGYPF